MIKLNYIALQLFRVP